MNDESTSSGLAPELEARIVALLLGEASDFERDELERLMEDRADARDFRDQMRAVYGLLEHAAGDVPLSVPAEFTSEESVTDELQSEWKLSDDRRSVILALFTDQEVAGKVSTGDVDDGSLTEQAAHGAGLSSDDPVQKSLLTVAPRSKGATGMLQKGAARLLFHNRGWVTAAGLLLLLGCASVWFYSNVQYVTTSSRVASDSRVMEEAPTAESPVSASPSDSASGEVNGWFGRSGPAYSATAEPKQEDEMLGRMLGREMLERESLRGERDAGFDADMDRAMEAEMSRSVNGVGSEGNGPRISDYKKKIDGEDDVSLSVNGRLMQSEELKEEAEPQLSVSSMPAAGGANPPSPSAATRSAAALPSSSLYSGGTESLNRVSPSLGERGQAEQRSQSAVRDQSIVDDNADDNVNGVFRSELNQMGGGAGGGGMVGGLGGAIGGGGFFGGMDGGGMGGGGMGGGGSAGKGMEGIVATRRKSSGLVRGGGIELEDGFGEQLHEQAAGQIFEKRLSRDGANSDLAAADPFGRRTSGRSASEAKAGGNEGRAGRPTSGVPIPNQPSASVNGPGPGLLNDVEVIESSGKISESSSKRLSGVSGGRQTADAVGSENNEIAFDGIARFEANKEKDALKREVAKEPAKKRKLAILGKKTDLQASVPSGFPELDASANGFSTFSLHVSDVSFKLAQAALNKGEWPDASRIRSEEFLNAFDYGDPMPTQNERVSCRVEQSIHPFLQQRNLLRVAMRTAAAGRSSSTPLRLTFLLDNSGSMERADRQQTVRRAFAVLAQQLKPIDEVTLISFARQPRLLADRISGAAAGSLVQTIENLPSEGGTNLEAALGLAFEKAQEQYQEAAQNRIILLTDGAVNLGDASPKRLAEMIVRMRNNGIAFDAAGISADGLNDEILEALTRKGDGRYYLLDSLESVEDGFAKQIAGALRPAAKNVKIQVEFNPERVGKYKLLGFEKHRLKKEDFRNDKVDAAEMAAAEAGVALYQVQTKPDGYGDIGTVSIRFRDLDSGNMVEELWPIPYETEALRPDLASNSMKIATVASLFAIKLKGDVLADTVDLKELTSLISSLAPEVRNDPRIKKLEVMIQQARQISGE